MLPLILSLLGSGAAGAGMLGAMSPLVAGAVGSGLGSWAETGDLEKGLMSGLGGFLGGSLLGNMMGGTSPSALSAGGANLAAGPGVGGSISTTPLMQRAIPAATSGASTGGGILDTFQNMPAGVTPVTPPMEGALGGNLLSMDTLKTGLNQGVMTGGGIGSALGGTLAGSFFGDEDGDGKDDEGSKYEHAAPFNRDYIPAPEGYAPGIDPEHAFFSPTNIPSGAAPDTELQPYRNPSMMGYTARLAGGGLADMIPQAAPQQGPSDKQILQGAVAAIRGELPEEQAAVVMGLFLQKFGEEALRKLVDEVSTSGSAGKRTPEGMIEGAGGPKDDLVPAEVASSGQDVLLSDGEGVLTAEAMQAIGPENLELINKAASAGGMVAA